MLGSIKASKKWVWAAVGKHPAAKDYFWVGAATPILEAFSRWIETGYHRLAATGKPYRDDRSWRFWARGGTKDRVLCGLVKSSSDKIGRTYPLLIAGTGPLEGFEVKWDLVLFACDAVWNRMEYIGARRLADVAQLENELHALRPPVGDWSQLELQRGAAAESENVAGAGDIAEFSERDGAIIPLAGGDGTGAVTQAGVCHYRLKARGGRLPHAVFLGGGADRIGLAIFDRALNPIDFVKLWTFEGEHPHMTLGGSRVG